VFNKKRAKVFSSLIRVIKISIKLFYSIFFKDFIWGFFVIIIVFSNTYFLFISLQSPKDILLFPIITLFYISKFLTKNINNYENKPKIVICRDILIKNLKFTIIYILIFNKLPATIELLKYDHNNLINQLFSISDLRLLFILILLNIVLAFILQLLITIKLSFIQCESQYAHTKRFLVNSENPKIIKKLHKINLKSKNKNIADFYKSKLMFILVYRFKITLEELPSELELIENCVENLITYENNYEKVFDFINELATYFDDVTNLHKMESLLNMADFDIISEFNKKSSYLFNYSMELSEEEAKDFIFELFNNLLKSKDIDLSIKETRIG
jgi:hypothetical protein